MGQRERIRVSAVCVCVCVQTTHQFGGPVEICLAHQATYAAIPRGVSDEKAAIAHMTRASGVVWLDVKAAQTLPFPIAASPGHFVELTAVVDLAQQHNSTEDSEPVRAEVVEREWLDHGVRVTLFDFAAKLVA